MLQRIREAAEKAILRLPLAITGTAQKPLHEHSSHLGPLFHAVIVGMAGVDRPADVAILQRPLANLFSICETRLKIGNDAFLLSIPMAINPGVSWGVALVAGHYRRAIYCHTNQLTCFAAGTGSVCFLFRKGADSAMHIATRRGGYGHLLGDEGSGYHVGKLAIADLLDVYDRGQTLTTHQTDICEHFGCREQPEHLLQRIYESESAVFPHTQSVGRIASVCKLILDAAYPEDKSTTPAVSAEGVSKRAIRALVDLVKACVTAQQEAKSASALASEMITNSSMLVLGGSLFKNDGFRCGLLEELELDKISFNEVHVAIDAGAAAAVALAQTLSKP